MNTNDLLVNWSTLSIDEIETRLETGTDEAAATQLFGAGEVAEMQTIMEQPRASGARKAVVLLPGIMGSLLSSIRGVTALLWINPMLFVRGQSSYLELSQDGSRDGSPEIHAVATALEKMVYTKIALAFRRQVDLYEFPYDWRRPIEWNGDVLSAYIERWAAGDPDKTFTLVGHSMGGLVSRAYMARHTAADEKRIERLIMHGTPHFGAAGAVENILNGNRMMDIAAKLNDKNVPRRLIMNMPSVYQLLPAPPALFPDRPYPANWDLYDAQAWRLDDMRQDYLDAGKAFHQLLADSDPQIETIEIAGCNQETIVDVTRSFGPGERPEYDIIRQAEGADGGDATVPLWSAIVPGAKIYYVEEVHRYLSKNGKVIEGTLELIHDGEPSELETELPPFDPGWFPFETPPPVEDAADDLRLKIEEGTATDQDLSQLYFAV